MDKDLEKDEFFGLVAQAFMIVRWGNNIRNK